MGTPLLGIDVGTTALKVAATDGGTGRFLGKAGWRLAVRVSPDGGREQDLPRLDGALASAVRELRGRLGPAWDRIAGVGLAAQGGSTLVADRASGRALTPMFLWNDGRVGPWLERIAARVDPGFWSRFVLYDSVPHGLGQLLWLKERRPELFGTDTIHSGAGEYVFHQLTGVWRQDAGHAIQIGSYNAASGRLDPAALELAGIPLSFVAPLRQGHETARLSAAGARLLSLREGLPVTGPYIDQEAGYMSCMGVSARPLLASLGTAWVGNFVLPPGVPGDSPSMMALPSPGGAGRLIVQALRTGNTAWDWALTALVDPDIHQALRLARGALARNYLPREGLVALPWFAQPNPLAPDTRGGGAFLGVSAETERTALVRAVAASMAFEFYRMFEPVARQGVLDAVVLGGGASQGAHFRKLLAGLFAPLPVYWQTDADAAPARGTLLALSAKAARPATRRIPVPDAATRIRGAYAQYAEVFARLYGSVPGAAPFQCRTRAL